MKVYAATTNSGKLAEFATSASTAGITVLPLPNLATLPEPIEDATTFIGNAEIKALAYSLASPDLLVFADDSGLEVDALHGAPGVRSARYADDQASIEEGCPMSGFSDMGVPPPPPKQSKDTRNNNCLLQNLGSTTNRAARFRCALALALNGEVLLRAEGTVEGLILTAPRGTAGFGYDPLFLLPTLNLTMAELPREQKWQLSHRGNAFRSLLDQINHRTDLR